MEDYFIADFDFIGRNGKVSAQPTYSISIS